MIELLVAAGTALPRGGGLACQIGLLGLGIDLGGGRLQLVERQRQLVVGDTHRAGGASPTRPYARSARA